MNRTGLRLAFRPLSFMDAHADLPDAVLEPGPGRLLAWDTEILGTLFRTDRALAHPGSRHMRPLLGPKSLIWAEGERHAAYRRVLGAPLQGRRLARRHDTIATMRITPPVAAAGPRTSLSGLLVVPGRACPPGTVVIPGIYLSHRRAEHFPEPRRFLPGRFLSSDRHPEGYLPFGGGTRYCLGAQMAPLEVRMTVAALLRRRELRCVNPDAGVPRMRGQVIVPSERLRMRVTSSRG